MVKGPTSDNVLSAFTLAPIPRMVRANEMGLSINPNTAFSLIPKTFHLPKAKVVHHERNSSFYTLKSTDSTISVKNCILSISLTIYDIYRHCHEMKKFEYYSCIKYSFKNVRSQWLSIIVWGTLMVADTGQCLISNRHTIK